MASAKTGNLVQLFLRLNSSTSWKYATCNTEIALEAESEIIEEATKCGVFKQPGTKSFTIPFSAFSNYELGANEISHNQLWDWFVAGSTIEFILGDSAGTAVIAQYTGTGKIGSLSQSFNVDEFIGYEFDLIVDGTPTRVV
jgi:hypothetical protein